MTPAATAALPSPPQANDRVRVLTWNVGHRAGTYPKLPEEVVKALRLLDADVVLLNEFYDDGRHDRQLFRNRLADIGYHYCDQSAAGPRHNRVFIASRLEFQIGDISAPDGPTSHAATNFLHVRLKASQIQLIGLRRPSYRGAERLVYWNKVSEILRSSGDRALAVAGDLNENLFKKASSSATSLRFPFAEMYSVPRPEGSWSYTNPAGTAQTPIDHVLHTDRIRIHDPRYHYGVGRLSLAAPGPLKTASLSDHAPLTFSVELSSKVLPKVLPSEHTVQQSTVHPVPGELR